MRSTQDKPPGGKAGNRHAPTKAPARDTATAVAATAAPTATQLFALQRAMGNAAVNRLLAAQRHVHDAGCGHGEQTPVQRSSVPGVLQSGGQPLPGPLRSEMEGRLGADFSDVRLHTGGAAQRSAAELGARAYTAGSHVVIGAGGTDKHTLAHELTHVIQQRQGPVAGTDNGSGLAVSDPGDRFEQAAEANARQVMARPIQPSAADAPADGPTAGQAAATGSAAPAVQRKVGFEFEVTSDNWKFHEVDVATNKKKLKTDTKAGLIPLPNQATVGADNGHIEFITQPLSTLAEVHAALAAIIGFHQRLSAAKSSEFLDLADPNKKYKLSAAGAGAAKPQASFGIAMRDIGDLVAALTALAAVPTAANAVGSSGRPKRSKAITPEQDVRDRVTAVSPGLAGAGAGFEDAETVITGLGPAPADRAEAIGFLAVILKTLYDIDGKATVNTSREDPKYFFSMMPRTDFKSMLASLQPAAVVWLVAQENAICTALDGLHGAGWIDGSIFARAYKTEQSIAGQALTRRAWLTSVFDQAPATGAGDAKDALSPPPGYERHNPEPGRPGHNPPPGDPLHNPAQPFRAPEGVGAMGTDRDEPHLSVFELRDLGDPLPVEHWTLLAETVARLVGRATHDPRLTG